MGMVKDPGCNLLAGHLLEVQYRYKHPMAYRFLLPPFLSSLFVLEGSG